MLLKSFLIIFDGDSGRRGERGRERDMLVVLAEEEVGESGREGEGEREGEAVT